MAADGVLTSAAECSAEAVEVPLDVTLVTQASYDRLWAVPYICSRWGGTMVAVAHALSATALEWPVGTGRGCNLTRLQLQLRSGPSTDYPINWLRNQGIACVRTSHYFVLDVDFWPSVQLLDLIRGQLPPWGEARRALVVPNFQRSGHGCRNDERGTACRDALDAGSISMPANFSALSNCLDARDCSVFDIEYNPLGQSSTNTRAWRKLAAGDVAPIRCLLSNRYEPFVVLRRARHTPLYDERFHGYGKNKVQMTVHLRLAGFGFEVSAGTLDQSAAAAAPCDASF